MPELSPISLMEMVKENICPVCDFDEIMEETLESCSFGLIQWSTVKKTCLKCGYSWIITC